MKLKQEEFRCLQKTWYRVLSDSGFKDIERFSGSELVLVQTAAACYRNTDHFTRLMKEEYFRCMAKMANDEETEFRNEIDRYILVRHSEGAMINVIMTELEARGMKRNRASIRFIVRRYEDAWGIRKYEPRKLNVRTR
jgi:hypothetical protein